MFNNTLARKQIGYWLSEQGRDILEKTLHFPIERDLLYDKSKHTIPNVD